MNKYLANILAATMAATGGEPTYPYNVRYKSGGTQKTYDNKNANIEYYTDEKGNIRRRKINKKGEGK